jgi:type I restriction enzyme S subunit
MKINKLEVQDICDFVGGSQPPKEVFSNYLKEGYIRLIQIRDYKGDNFVTYIPKELARKFCDEKDIMIGRYGPPIFQILRGLKGAYNVALMKAVPKENILNEYLYYFLKQDSLFKYVDGLSLRTGGQTGVDIDSLKKYPISLPSLNYQKKIVDVLSALDAKIEVNNRLNAELESIAKTIYDYWFVQFDFPNEDGKPYKASGGEMVYHPELKREIPAGWEVKELGDISKNIRNTIKETDINPDTAYIGLEHIPRKQIFLDSWSTAFNINSAKSYFNKRDILFGKLRPYFHKVGIAFVSGVCSTDILVLNSKKDDYFGFLLMIVSSDDFINYVSSAMEGTRMPRTKWEFMKKYLFAVPPQSLARDFNEFLKPFISKMENNVSENQQLTQLRDWLLPLLMNGQITFE